MKFKDIFEKVAKQYLTEQQVQDMMNDASNETEQVQQPEVNPEMQSELPTEETIDLNEEKYKALLLMVQKALILAYKDDTNKRNDLADIESKIETSPKEAESSLQSLLDSNVSNFPENSFN